MPRPPLLNIRELPSGKFAITLPPSLSATGKRTQVSFDNDKAADLWRTKIIEKARLYGVEGQSLHPTLVRDAQRAFDLLEGRDISLTAIVKEYLDREGARSASVTLRECWERYLDSKGEISTAYQGDLKRYSARLLELHGETNLLDLEPDDIETAIREVTKTPRTFANAFRTIRPAFSYAVRRGWIESNPFDRLEKPKATKGKTEILTLKEIRAVLSAIRDHRKNKNMPECFQLDCRDCTPAVALMLWAGIRPKEVERLQWEAIHFDHEVVRISDSVAKTRSTRLVPMSENLIEWLKLTPERKRTGPIVPLRWGAKIKTIRRVAGIGAKQDCMRHSYASYHLAAHGDIRELMEGMGHGTPEMVLKHYRALCTKRDALAFWSISPSGSTPKIKEVV